MTTSKKSGKIKFSSTKRKTKILEANESKSEELSEAIVTKSDDLSEPIVTKSDDFSEPIVTKSDDFSEPTLIFLDEVAEPTEEIVYSRKTEQDFQKALTLQQAEKYDRAASIYQHILMDQPTHIGALMNLGAIRYAEGRDEIALQMFDVVTELNPRHSDAWYNRGKVLLALSHTVDAIKSFEEALLISPSDRSTLIEYGSACIQGLEPARFLEYLESNGENILRHCGEVKLLEAEAYLKSGSFEKASVILRKLVDSTPGDAFAFALLSKTYFSSRDFDRAATAIKRALMIDPESASFHRELGIIHAVAGNVEEANESFKEADRLDPYNETAQKGKQSRSPSSLKHWDELALQMYLMERMRYWAIRGEWRGAVNELIVLNKKYPGKNCVLQELAYAYQLNGEAKRARVLYQQLLERDNNNLEVQLQLTEIALELEEVDEALEFTRKIVNNYPNLGTGLILRGRALMAAEHNRSASLVTDSQASGSGKALSSPEDSFLKALQVMPTSVEAMEHLGEIYVSEERYSEAVSILERAVSGRLSGFASLHCLRMFARACKGAGELKKLQHVLEQATKRTPDSIDTLIELARIFIKLNMTDKAGSVYTSITQLDQDDSSKALFHLEAQLYCRNDVEVKRLLHIHKKGFSQLKEAMLFGSLYSFLHCKESTNSIRWQRFWSVIDSTTMGEWKEYISAIMTPYERKTMLEDLQDTARLFRRRDGVKARAIMELAEELERSTAS
jgi:tetratricopeptide (TPR) repeat protein